MLLLLIPSSSSSSSEVEVENVGRQLRFGTVTFDLSTGVSGYSSFLTRLRNKLEAPTRACGIQSTRNTPIPGQEYVLVQLKISNTQWVTLGINTTDIYVYAYQDNVKYNGQFRATFLKGSPEATYKSLFQGSTQRTTRFNGNYDKLESAAQVKRRNLALGVENLRAAIINVYGKQETELDKGPAEAKFFLLAIQMVSEAARFKFMEQGIVAGNKTVAFKNKMVAFQNDWSAISNAIHNAELSTRKCTTISPTLVISNIDYRQEVTKVDQIKSDMGILLHKEAGLSVEMSSIMGIDEI